MSGKAAAFGGRMMNSVADQILKQFADNFAARSARSRRNERLRRRRQRRRLGCRDACLHRQPAS